MRRLNRLSRETIVAREGDFAPLFLDNEEILAAI